MLAHPVKRHIWTAKEVSRGASCLARRREFTTSPCSRSGHNKWSKIKHDKSKNDQAKSKERSLLVKDLTESSRYGGDNVAMNPRLGTIIEKCQKANLPRSTIEAAILRGQGKSTTGAPLDTITIEAMIRSVAIIFDCQTESKSRALQDLRVILKEYEGTTSQTAHMFDKRGRLVLDRNNDIGVDEVLIPALDAGALDVLEDEDGNVVVETALDSLRTVEKAIKEQLNVSVKNAETFLALREEMAAPTQNEDTLAALHELNVELLEYPGVDQVYANLTEPDYGKLPTLA